MKRSPLKHWFETRRWRQLWWSIPALLAFASWVAFGYLMLRWKHQEIAAQYSSIVERALDRKDFETARIGSQRLLSLRADPRAKWLFNLGLSLVGLGRDREAANLFSSIAPLDKPGYPDAHVFLAQTLLSKTNLTAEDIQTAEKHLVHALSVTPKAEVNELLAQIYIRTGQLELACERLLEMVPKHPEVSLLLAEVFKARGDSAAARSWAERAAKFHREEIEKSRLDQPLHRCAWAEALLVLENYPASFTVLTNGWSQSAHPAYPSRLGDVCAAWVEAASKNSPGDLDSRIYIIQRGLQFAPQNEVLLRHLVRVSQFEGKEGQTARETLSRTLAEGKAAAIIHFALGLDAWQRGQPDLARKHFALSFDTAPQMPDVGNNMALILAIGDKPDLPRALGIIQSVLEKFPQNANFRETRGEVLVKLGRWQEAVLDLEYALPTLGSRRNTHAALAEAYHGLGSQELAAQHEKLAKSLAQTTH